MLKKYCRRVGMVGVVGALFLGVCGTMSAGAATTKYQPTTPAPHPLPAKTSVTVAVSAKIEPFIEPALAAAEGEFAKTNLNVTVKVVPQTQLPVVLAHGTVALAIGGFSAGFLNAIHTGVPMVFVGDIFSYEKTAATGLWGSRKVFTSTGAVKKTVNRPLNISVGLSGTTSAAFYPVQVWAKKHGITFHQVNTVKIATPTKTIGLESGSLDAAVLDAPFTGEIADNPNYVKLFPNYAAAVAVTSKAELTAHRPVVEAILRSMMRSARTYLTPGYRNNQTVMSVLSSFSGVTENTIKKSPPLVFSLDMSMVPIEKTMQGMQQDWLQYGGILQYIKPIPYKTLVTNAVIVAAGK